METFVITGGSSLKGEISIQGAKNVALKIIVCSLLTDDELIIHDIPLLSDVQCMLDVLAGLGVKYKHSGHTLSLRNTGITNVTVPLDVGARLRTSSMVVGPLLARYGKAVIPNPGGCRLGSRPIDRHIDALQQMGAAIEYDPQDGYFHLTAKKLTGTTIVFPKNTHTGTETLLLAAVLATGTTVLKNAAEEVEVDDLILLLNNMGAQIKRTASREITIHGVDSLHGATHTVMPDRNEEVTFAVAAAITRGSITVHKSQRNSLRYFTDAYRKTGAHIRAIDETTTEYSFSGTPIPVDIQTMPHPGFMTDWQAPWAVFMTQAAGVSHIHETVFESRFAYVEELRKMGADLTFFEPHVHHPETYYNFNWADRIPDSFQGLTIHGPTKLHNAILTMHDLRAGATLVLAALIAQGQSIIHGIEQIDRGYERIEDRLRSLGASIARKKEEV